MSSTKQARDSQSGKKPSRKGVGGAPKGSGSKYTPELGAEICQGIAEGNSARSTCAKHGIALATFYNWQREHPQFASQVSQAREDQADSFADEMSQIAESHEDVQRAKLIIDARKWVASRMKPKSWGDRLHVDQKTTVQSLSDEELERQISQQLRALQAQGIDISKLLK